MWTADIRLKWRSDHRSCDCDLSNRKVSPKNVFGASTGFESMASALVLQCFTNWAMKTHTLGAGQFVEFVVPVKGMKHMNIMWTADIRMKWRCDHRSCSSQSTAALTQRPRVRIPLMPRKHFSGLFCDCRLQSQLRWSHLHFICSNLVGPIGLYVIF